MLYEVMMIVNPEIGEDGIEKVLSRFNANVTKNEGEIIRTDDLGVRNMAYKIQRRSRARYLLSYLEGPGSMMSELERTLKIDENVLRFLLIKLDDEVKREDLEKVATEEAPAAAPEAPQEAPAAPEKAEEAPAPAPESSEEGE